MSAEVPVDVLVLGGGLAGLAFAAHLRSLRPHTRIAVLDPRPLPIDPAVRKVGESLTEASSWYFGERLGLEEHLRGRQVRKLGLRFFLEGGLGRDFGARPEMGILAQGSELASITASIPPTWQVHRGRIEHALAERERAQGLTLLQGELKSLCLDVGALATLGDGRRIRARWVVDGSAGGTMIPGVPAREDFDHEAAAAWAWVERPLDVQGWSPDPSYQDRVAHDVRWRSTTHLVGEGAWVWIIRLADQATSVGVVYDPNRHDPSALSTAAGMRAWLREREPVCADAIEGVELTGFTARRWRSGGVPMLVSEEGWALTGDATGFLDPLYSSGLDLVAVANELVVPLLARALDGERVSSAIRRANGLFAGIRAQYLNLYRGIFEVMGHPEAFFARILWDLSTYFGFLAPLTRSGELGVEGGVERVLWHARQLAALQERVGELLLCWARAPRSGPAPALFDQARSPALMEMLHAMRSPLQGRALVERFDQNLRVIEGVAVVIFARAMAAVGTPVPRGPLNPYAISPDPARWTCEGLQSGVRCVDPAQVRGLGDLWTD